MLLKMDVAKLLKEEALTSLGLTKNETRVLLTLFREGANTIAVIAKMGGLHRANTYEAVESLKQKGLINYIKDGNKTIFQATDPSNLLNILKEKELLLENILPQLKIDHTLSSKKNSIEIFEGVNAIRNLMNHYVEKNEGIYDYGVPKMAITLLGGFFQNSIHKKRAKQKQWMYHIYNSDAKERINFLNTLPYTKAKCLGPEYDFPVTTRICGDEVSITLYSENPVTIVIKNKQMADTYKKYFEILWSKCSVA